MKTLDKLYRRNYEAFRIKEGDKLFIPKENRLSIW